MWNWESQINIVTLILYTLSLVSACRRSRQKGLVFIQFLVSCKKLLEVLINSEKRMWTFFVKFQCYNQNEVNSFICIFKEFQYLIDFTFLIENLVKHWKNKAQALGKEELVNILRNAFKKETEKYRIVFWRWTLVVAVISVDAYPLLVFSDLTCCLEDMGIGVFWLHCAAW